MAEKTITSSLFSISEAIRFGWETTKKNFWLIVATLIIPFVINYAISLIDGPLLKSDNGFLKIAGILAVIASYFISYAFTFGRLSIYFKLFDKKKTEVNELFAYFDLKLIWRYFVIVFAYGFLCAIGLVLFIFPGIYFATKYWFAPYIYVDKRTGIMESFKESEKLSQGIKRRLFLLGLVQAGIIIAGALALVVGLLVALPINTISDIYVYRKLQEQK